MSLYLNNTTASKAIHLFVELNKLENVVSIHKAQEGSQIHIDSKDGKFYGPITVCRYLNTLAKEKSFLVRKDDYEFALIHQWMNFALQNDLIKNLAYLNKVIQSGTFFVGNSLSFADLFIYTALEAHISAFDKKEYVSLARWYNFVQHFDVSKKIKDNLKLDVIPFAHKVIPDLAPKKEEKKPEVKPTEVKKETTEIKKEEVKPVVEVKKEKGDKVEKVKAPKKVEEPKKEDPVICLADIRVGHILSVKKHEKADRLYVEQIDLGEDKPRTICSGLVLHMGPEELDQKKVLVFCNLKPKNAVGIDSYGMVLCATDNETKKVELVKVRQDLKPGTKVQWGDLVSKPDTQLHERKLKPILEGLHTNGDGFVCFGDYFATVDGNKCCSSFKDAHVS